MNQRGAKAEKASNASLTGTSVPQAPRQGHELVTMRWGPVPHWWKKSLKELPATFNARAESVVDKPVFRDAFRRRRCIIPASGSYKWTGAKAARQPHLFTAADCLPIVPLAGLW